MLRTEAPSHLALLALLMAPELAASPAHADFAQRLRTLTWAELTLLARAGHPRVELRLDVAGIDHALRGIRELAKRQQQLDHFILHGATNAMIRCLFRLPVADIKARRAQLLGAHRQRRPRLPKPAERDAVHAAWWALREGRRREAPRIDDWMQLHGAFPRYSFATLDAIVNEFDD
jgi:hypothetical protein